MKEKKECVPATALKFRLIKVMPNGEFKASGFSIFLGNTRLKTTPPGILKYPKDELWLRDLDRLLEETK